MSSVRYARSLLEMVRWLRTYQLELLLARLVNGADDSLAIICQPPEEANNVHCSLAIQALYRRLVRHFTF